MYKAIEIAYWFLFKNYSEKIQNETNEEKYDGISNMKLQKLLYFAQGCFLALFNKKLFDDQLLAWKHGPVVRSVYNEFNRFGANDIELAQNVKDKYMNIVGTIDTDQQVKEILEEVYDTFNKYTAWQLRNLSHDPNGAWAKVFDGNNKTIIKEDLLKKYFAETFIE